MLTQSELKKILAYNTETGVFSRNGRRLGRDNKKHYIKIRINNKNYMAHRLAWLYVYGEFPKNQLDHVNGVIYDNRTSNLRECTDGQNKFNIGKRITNTSGFIGATKNGTRWRAQIRILGRNTTLGCFTTAELASEAYQAKAKELHGAFYRETNKTGKL